MDMKEDKEMIEMHDMTASNLRSAFGGESMAHMRYGVWGAKAQEDGFPNVARLFRAIAYAEEVHASNHFKAMADVPGAFLVASMAGYGLGTASENLEGAIEGETFEISEMYPVYKQTADYQGEKGAARSFHYALSAERIHAAMYQEAKQAVDGGNDIELGDVQICGVCGYTTEGEVPDKCPVCAAAREQFRTFA
ncbi:MAG: rubrerythrin family protein [bacterium]|nr:rubrerythrin family protein [bacterium]